LLYNNIEQNYKIEDVNMRKQQDIELEQIRSCILNGQYGMPGDKFVTVRQLALQRKIALVTAQRLFDSLWEENLITKYSGRYYITTGTIPTDSTLALNREKKSKNKHLIGIHITNIESLFFTALANKLQEDLARINYRLIIAASGGNEHTEISILKQFIEMGVSGVFSFPGYTERVQRFYNHYPIPIVLLGRQLFKCKNSAVLWITYKHHDRLPVIWYEKGSVNSHI